VTVITTDLLPHAMRRIDPTGLFEALFADRHQLFTYRLETPYPRGAIARFDDPYRL